MGGLSTGPIPVPTRTPNRGVANLRPRIEHVGLPSGLTTIVLMTLFVFSVFMSHFRSCRAWIFSNFPFYFQGMMTKAGYPDFPAHKQMHDDFVAKVGGLSAPVGADTINFAKDW